MGNRRSSRWTQRNHHAERDEYRTNRNPATIRGHLRQLPTKEPCVNHAQPIKLTKAQASSLAFPFQHLNLRFNPFGELPLKYRAQLAIVEIDSYLEELQNDLTAIQFMADKGRGKTTHLLAIQDQFPEAAYVHLPEDSRPPIPQGSPLFVDEVQRLNWFQRASVFRRPVPLVLGTHCDYRRQLRRFGRHVITVHVGEKMAPEVLTQIVQRRIEFARRQAGAVPKLTPQTIARLIETYGDDVRAIEGHLYNVFQQLEEPGDV